MKTKIQTSQIVDRLTNAPEGVDSYNAEANKNTVDVFLLHSIEDKTFEEWLSILREVSGCKVSYASSMARFAVLCSEQDEPAVRAAIEATLPGLRAYYETVEGPQKDSHWDAGRSRLPGCWYVTDRGYYRRVSAVTTDEELHRIFGRLELPLPSGYEQWDSCQRGCAYEWASTYVLAKEWNSNPLDCGGGGLTEVPSFMATYDPAHTVSKTYLAIERRSDNRIRRTEYLVEATSTEQQWLWRDYSTTATKMSRFPTPDRFPTEGFKVDWQQDVGMGAQVGTLDGRPVMVTVSWNFIDDHLVGFWCSESQVTDHKMIEAWLDETFPGIPRGESSRFVHVIRDLREK